MCRLPANAVSHAPVGLPQQIHNAQQADLFFTNYLPVGSEQFSNAFPEPGLFEPFIPDTNPLPLNPFPNDTLRALPMSRSELDLLQLFVEEPVPTQTRSPEHSSTLPALVTNSVESVGGSPDEHLQHLKEAAKTVVGGPPPLPAKARVKRADKTQQELEQQTERIKKRRRESAQRSRARKNEYMTLLEAENKALRGEIAQLRQVLGVKADMVPSAAQQPTVIPARFDGTQQQHFDLSPDFHFETW